MSTITLDDINIRTDLQPGDLGYVIYMHGKLYKKEYNYGIQFEGYVAGGLLEFLQLYDPKSNRVWICEHHGRMIGFMLLLDRGDTAQLRYFIIEPEYRGIGLGKKLMDLFMEFLHACRNKSSYLLTTDELPAAAHLYTSKGFVVTEARKSDGFGKPVVEQRYELMVISS